MPHTQSDISNISQSTQKKENNSKLYSELLNTQNNTEQFDENKPLFTREEIPDTPFVKVTDHEKNEYHITLGKYRINKEPITNTYTNEDVRDWLEENKYEVMLSIAIITNLNMQNK